MFDDRHLGYNLHDRPYPHAPGCLQLDVILTRTPSEHHFDPERMHLEMATGIGSVAGLTVSHPWQRGTEPVRICAGHVILEDRVKKRVEFLTLGGSLTIEPGTDATLCTLVSEAPIIELGFNRGVGQLLAEEIEVILARERAKWEVRSGEFERRLTSADPAALYEACLSEVRMKFRSIPHRVLDRATLRLIQFVDQELAIRCGDANLGGTALEDIL
jgi:hypothetical protein